MLSRLLILSCCAWPVLAWMAAVATGASWPRCMAASLVVVVSGLAIALMLEFVGARWINGRARAAPLAGNVPAPAPTWSQIAAAWWREMCCALKVFLWWQPWRSNAFADYLPESPTGRRGVVLIHGFMCNRGLWTPWFPLLRARGHAHIAVNLEPVWGSIDQYVPLIDDAVKRVTQATGMPPVLVCHSMGGLAARAWLRAGLRTLGAGRPKVRRVERVITIGTPHHGTWLAYLNLLGFIRNARQMQQNSHWLMALQADEADYRTGSAPGVGGGAFGRFICFFSHCDNIVFPASTATLRGADNRHVPGVAHVAMALEPQLIKECLRVIDSV